MQKTEQNHPQQIPALPDFAGQNTVRAKIDYRMPGIDNVFGVKNVVEVWMTGNKVVFHLSPPQTTHLKIPQPYSQPKILKKLFFAITHAVDNLVEKIIDKVNLTRID